MAMPIEFEKIAQYMKIIQNCLIFNNITQAKRIKVILTLFLAIIAFYFRS